MPEYEFETPTAIRLRARLGTADVRIEATDRSSTLVEVLPNDPSSAEDTAAAERVRVSCSDGEVRIDEKRGRRDTGSFDVAVSLPLGSSADLATGTGDVIATGRLDHVKARLGSGDAEIDHAAAIDVASGSGDLSISTADGRVRTKAGSGDVRIGEAHAGADVKAGSGGIEIAVAHAGEFGLLTGTGDIVIGIPEGTAALLDVMSGTGRVESELDGVASPTANTGSATIRAKSGTGDIRVRRAVVASV